MIATEELKKMLAVARSGIDPPAEVVVRLAQELLQLRADLHSEPTFEQQLRALLNTWSIEKGSNTPDFVLAQFMARCLEAFSGAVNNRDQWHGFKPFAANTAVDTPRATLADVGGTKP